MYILYYMGTGLKPYLGGEEAGSVRASPPDLHRYLLALPAHTTPVHIMPVLIRRGRDETLFTIGNVWLITVASKPGLMGTVNFWYPYLLAPWQPTLADISYQTCTT